MYLKNMMKLQVNKMSKRYKIKYYFDEMAYKCDMPAFYEICYDRNAAVHIGMIKTKEGHFKYFSVEEI